MMKQEKILNKTSLFKRKWFFKILSMIALFLPMVLLVIIRRKVYFVENTNAYSVGIGGIIVIIFTILLCKVGFKKMHPVAWAGFIVAIVQCFYSIIQDIRPISWAFFIGVALYSILSIPTNYYTKILDTWVDEEVRTVVREQKRKTEENIGGRA